MKAALLAGVAVGFFIQLGAQAATGSTQFTIDSLTPLGESPTAPMPPGAAGYWLQSGWVFGTIGTTAGPGLPVRNEFLYASTYPISGLGGPPFGSFDYSLPVTATQPASASMFLHPGSMGVAWETTLPTSSADASWNWSRPFALNAGASITLEGTFTHTSSLGDPPSRTTLQDGPGYHDPWQGPSNTAYMSRVADSQQGASWFSYSLQGQLTTIDPRTGDTVGNPDSTWVPGSGDFEYSLDSFGHASMTIFNRSSEQLFGWLVLGIHADSPVAAIPEPATWMTMLLGVAVLAGLSRRREPARFFA